MKRYGWKIFDRCSQKLFSVNPTYCPLKKDSKACNLIEINDIGLKKQVQAW